MPMDAELSREIWRRAMPGVEGGWWPIGRAGDVGSMSRLRRNWQVELRSGFDFGAVAI